MQWASFLTLLAVCVGCTSLPRLTSLPHRHSHAVCPCCTWRGGESTAAAQDLHEQGNVPELAALAEAGAAEAQYLLAVRLYRGHGIEQDVDRSTFWLRQAAFQEHPIAQFVMGESYARGEGAERDERQAVRWYQLAAAHGLGRAMFALAESYRLGAGVEPDRQQARSLYRRLADQSRCELRRHALRRLDEMSE